MRAAIPACRPFGPVTVLLACALAGCAPVKGRADVGAVETVPFCNVAEHPESYRGRAVRLGANYFAEGSDHEYLSLSSCANPPGQIDIGNHADSTSVSAFYEGTKRICAAVTAPIACIITTQVDVVGIVRERPADSGKYVLDVVEIKQSSRATH